MYWGWNIIFLNIIWILPIKGIFRAFQSNNSSSISSLGTCMCAYVTCGYYGIRSWGSLACNAVLLLVEFITGTFSSPVTLITRPTRPLTQTRCQGRASLTSTDVTRKRKRKPTRSLGQAFRGRSRKQKPAIAHTILIRYGQHRLPLPVLELECPWGPTAHCTREGGHSNYVSGSQITSH